MQTFALILAILGLALMAFWTGRARALLTVGGQASRLHSLPSYHGYYIALWCALPALSLLILWVSLEGPILELLLVSTLPQDVMEASSKAELALLINDIRNIAAGNIASDTNEVNRAAAARYADLLFYSLMARITLVLGLAAAGLAFGRKFIAPALRARNAVEKTVTFFMVACSTLAIFITIGIVLSLVFESIRFFESVPVAEFLFGTEWSPQTSLRADQVGSSGAFGALPLFAGTLLITLIAMVVAVPIGLLSAIYMSEYANRKARDMIKPVLEILAGIPTVVYGFFAALTVAPFFRDSGSLMGLDISSESALAAGAVMGIMIIPLVSSLSDDAITAVPQAQRDGSYALGGTRSETIRRVVLPSALPGIVGGILLAVSRAIGETMIVVMAAGLAANLTANPFQAVTTVTVQIVTLLVGDQEFDSPKTLAAFALGLVLFCVTLVLNMIALYVVRKYREQYE
ncbi:phosphate ABC transporter permease subunit PstC [Magnetospira sp. QH-2]|uniref:phosphate ABC transporter permease subunit PstC n=1 Tax=Magnetospira sp. (strain QH-2) TaxID=1288970 RepID=UPI0003E80F1D|nr:phosphate ABC transporter permease subunit PstC [Magnetospira sp. QH-2]CCQ73398.1 Putative phosphate ABC transporter, permease protein PstC [Magnetospira sp. QH-2]